MFSIVLRNAASTRRYSISSHGESGWEVTMEREGEIPHHVYYHDWHRVERALSGGEPRTAYEIIPEVYDTQLTAATGAWWR